MFPFLLKDFPRFFGRIESRDLICIRLTSQKNPFRIFICLLRVYVVMNKASEDGPPPSFFGKITAYTGLNLPELFTFSASIFLKSHDTKLRLKNKHARKTIHASRLNANGSI